jgi:hypothetical protein
MSAIARAASSARDRDEATDNSDDDVDDGEAAADVGVEFGTLS